MSNKNRKNCDIFSLNELIFYQRNEKSNCWNQRRKERGGHLRMRTRDLRALSV